LRWALMEVAWRAVKVDPYWKNYFEELKKRMHPNQAIACPGGLGQGDHRASPAGGRLVCANEARALSPLLARMDRLPSRCGAQIPDLVVGAG